MEIAKRKIKAKDDKRRKKERERRKEKQQAETLRKHVKSETNKLDLRKSLLRKIVPK